MIISASRRTDIPACYSTWFFNRIREGFVLVRNPFNPKQISKIQLTPEVVESLVFWTKNAAPMLCNLDLLKHYAYYFQYTLNPYGQELETHLPPLRQRIETFKRLADQSGKEKVIWRYDPILLNDTYTVQFHQEKFAELTEILKDHTEKCMLGFLDPYRHLRTILRQHNIHSPQEEEIETMAAGFRKIIEAYPAITLETCTEKVNLSHLNIPPGRCIDPRLIEKITGRPTLTHKDKNQRNLCHCAESIDIGTYESCLNGCIYCYAIKGNYTTACRNFSQHDKNSPLLIGHINPEDIIKERPASNLRTGQLSLF